MAGIGFELQKVLKGGGITNLFKVALAVCRTLPLSKKKNFQNSISRIKFLHECKFYKY